MPNKRIIIHYTPMDTWAACKAALAANGTANPTHVTCKRCIAAMTPTEHAVKPPAPERIEMSENKPKRRIKENVWGNLNGYEGVRKVKEFGTDEVAAQEWLRGIEPLPFEPLRLRDFDEEFRVNKVE